MALYVPGLSEAIEFATDKLTEFRIKRAVEQAEVDIRKASDGNVALAREQIDRLHRDIYGSAGSAGSGGSGGLVKLQDETIRQLREKDRESTFEFFKALRPVVIVIGVVVGLVALSRIFAKGGR